MIKLTSDCSKILKTKLDEKKFLPIIKPVKKGNPPIVSFKSNKPIYIQPPHVTINLNNEFYIGEGINSIANSYSKPKKPKPFFKSFDNRIDPKPHNRNKLELDQITNEQFNTTGHFLSSESSDLDLNMKHYYLDSASKSNNTTLNNNENTKYKFKSKELLVNKNENEGKSKICIRKSSFLPKKKTKLVPIRTAEAQPQKRINIPKTASQRNQLTQRKTIHVRQSPELNITFGRVDDSKNFQNV